MCIKDEKGGLSTLVDIPDTIKEEDIRTAKG